MLLLSVHGQGKSRFGNRDVNEFLNLADLAEPIEDANPSGPNCEYDADFRALDEIARGEPDIWKDRKLVYGAPPNWRAVKTAAVSLLGRTKDVRVALHFCRAQLGLEGLPGFVRGLELFYRLISDFWPTLHPQFDPDDGDSTARVNAIAGLADRDLVLRPLRNTVVLSIPHFGDVTVRHILTAGASDGGDGADEARSALTDCNLAECDRAELLAAATAAGAAAEWIKRIENYTVDQVGGNWAVNLDPVLDLLDDVRRVLDGNLSRRSEALPVTTGVPAQPPTPGACSPSASGPSALGPSAGGPTGPVPRVVSSRDDVIRMIDAICAYYAEAEPASPVPHLLRRAKRLVGQDFLDLLRDLVPDGVAQFETVSGHRRED